MKPRACVCAFVVLASLRAQGVVIVPPTAANVDGNTLEQEPFGVDRGRHVQWIDRSLLADLPLNSLVQELRYRRDGSLTTVPVMSRGVATPIWTVRLGNVAHAALQPPATFPTAASGEYTTVYSSKPTSFPALPLVGGGGPQELALKFLLDQPWQWKGPTLAIDHYVYEGRGQSYAYYMDAVQTGTMGGSVATVGLGCPSGQNRALGAAPDPGAGDLVFGLNGAPAAVSAIASLGMSTSVWNGVPLPFDLAGLGLPGCKVLVDLAIPSAMLTSGAGSAELRVPVPPETFLAGLKVFGQWVVSDPRVNPGFPYAVSDALSFTLGSEPAPRVATMSASGELANGGAGFVQLNRGLVVALRH